MYNEKIKLFREVHTLRNYTDQSINIYSKAADNCNAFSKKEYLIRTDYVTSSAIDFAAMNIQLIVNKLMNTVMT